MKTEATIIDGIKCYAPELAYSNNDYNENDFKKLFEIEEQNFWFKARNRVIKTLLENYSKDVSGSFLEIGCGTGFVLKGLSKFSNLRLTGAEIYLEGLKYAKQRLPEVEFLQLDATSIPFREQYDYIGAFDVLEHITEDENVMRNVYKALKYGGMFFISVPQHMFMWSIEDDVACHKRRYSKVEILSKLKKAGFEIKYHTSFVFSLFPLMMVSRFIKKNKQTADLKEDRFNEELKLNPLINKTFELILRIDELLIRIGVRLPFGGSLIVVAKKL